MVWYGMVCMASVCVFALFVCVFRFVFLCVFYCVCLSECGFVCICMFMSKGICPSQRLVLNEVDLPFKQN